MGGIIGELSLGGSVKNCYNLSRIKRTGYGKQVGGIIGVCQNWTEVSECYNLGNVESDDYFLGGLCGLIESSSWVHNSYISETATVLYKDNEVTNEVGWWNFDSNAAYGRLLGYFRAGYEELEQKQKKQMPTVYDVLNEFKSTDSTIWDKSNPNEPKLLWE